MENMEIYNAVRAVPDAAKRPITGGRLNGKTDINPMWRIKMLTEKFGPCGIGWTYTIDRQWTEAGANGEMAAFSNIALRVKVDGQWSEPIPGTGGSAFVSKDKGSLYTSDECYKMALTDAISVACKALGIGADVYWEKDRTKYSDKDGPPAPDPESPNVPPVCYDCGQPILSTTTKSGVKRSPEEVASMSRKIYGRALCSKCRRLVEAKADQQDPAS